MEIKIVLMVALLALIKATHSLLRPCSECDLPSNILNNGREGWFILPSRTSYDVKITLSEPIASLKVNKCLELVSLQGNVFHYSKVSSCPTVQGSSDLAIDYIMTYDHNIVSSVESIFVDDKIACNTDCTKHIHKEHAYYGSEDGTFQVIVPRRMSNWTMEVNFKTNKPTHFSMVNTNSDHHYKNTTIIRPIGPYVTLPAGQISFRYFMTYDAEHGIPELSHFYFYDEYASVTCGAKPQNE